MKTRLLYAVLSASMVIFLVQQVAQAVVYYSGNSRNTSYGVKATIYTPASAPYSPSFQDNWVSTQATPNFVQTGWTFGPGYTLATKYYESVIAGIHTRGFPGSQGWSTGVEYRVDCNNCPQSTWYAYINGASQGGWGPVTSPLNVQPYSEVHDNPTVLVNTRFSSVYFRNANYVWKQFNQANWREDAPYKVQKDFLYNYRNYGP